MAWANGSGRTSTREWRNLKRIAKRELEYECAKCGISGADAPLELDHIIPDAEGGATTLANVQWMCQPHHDQKMQREATRGKRRRAAMGLHPVEEHPAIARLRR